MRMIIISNSIRNKLFVIAVMLLFSVVKCFKSRVMNTTYPTIQSLGSRYSAEVFSYSQDEEKLLKHLFANYNPNIIPKESMNESLKLYFGLAMSQLINVYDKEQVMKTNVWIHMYWVDPFLQWSHLPEFQHISAIRVPYNKVWTPDIILFNNAHGKYDVSYKCKIVLYQQGSILWIPPAIYKSSCQINVKYFPFDQQTCEMIFGSWVYASDDLILDYFENMRNVDLNDYVPSGTWDLIDVPAHIEFYNDTATNKTKIQMVYKIKMRRKSLFYSVNLIIPTFLISILSVCVFYLPTDDGEKITLSLSILFALVVFFLLIAKIIPPTSIVVPLISKYLLFAFIMNILSVFNTCIVIGYYYKQSDISLIHPRLKYLFFNLLAPMLFLRRLDIDERKKMKNAYYHKRKESRLDKLKAYRTELLMKVVPGTNTNATAAAANKSQTLNRFEWEKQRDEHHHHHQHLSMPSSSKNKLMSMSNIDLAKSSTLYNLEKFQRVLTYDPDRGQFVSIKQMNYDEIRLGAGTTSALSSNNLQNYKDSTLRHNMHHHHHYHHRNRDHHHHQHHQHHQMKKSPSEQFEQQKRQRQQPRPHYQQPSDTFINTCKSVEYISNIIKDKAHLEDLKEDWKYLAAILDRLMLIIFTIGTIVGTYTTLFDAPYLFDASNEQDLIKANSYRQSTLI